MVQPTQTRISADDYYTLPSYAEHDLIQLIAGEVIVSIPPLHETIEVWTLGENEEFQRAGVYVHTDTFTSPTLKQDIAAATILGNPS